MKWARRVAASSLWAALVFMLASPGLHAQPRSAGDYPNRAIRVIVSFTTGGAADVTARIVGERLSDIVRQPVVIENRAGGGGVLALDLLRNAAPDGYTLGIASNSNATKPATMAKLPWDLARDFAYIAIAVDATMVLVGNPDRVAARNLAELTSYMRLHPGQYTYGSCGIASTQQFAMEKYRFRTGAVATHVPYKGCAVATPEVLSGQIDLAMLALSNALQYIRAGKLHAYGVTTQARSSSAPEVPAFRESGVPELSDFVQDAWYGFFAPAATPAPIVEFLASHIRQILATREVGARLHDVGLQPAFVGPEGTRQRMLGDVESFSRIAAAARIKAE
jgi:tripartite-type tricarboxylate transporter receptor subunit TctC